MEAEDNIRQPYDEFSTTSDSDESNTPSETDEVSQQQDENSSDEDLIQPVQDTEGRENQELSENIDVQLQGTNNAAPDTEPVNQTMSHKANDVVSERQERLEKIGLDIALSQFLWCLYSAYFTFVSPGAYLHLPVLAIFPLPSFICAFVVSARYLWSFDWRKSMKNDFIEDYWDDLYDFLWDRLAITENILLVVCLYLHFLKYIMVYYLNVSAAHVAFAIYMLDPLIYVIAKISHALLVLRKCAIMFRFGIYWLGFAIPFTQIYMTPTLACSYLNLQAEVGMLGAIHLQQYTCNIAYLDICPWHLILYTDGKQKLLVFVMFTSVLSLVSFCVKLSLVINQSSRKIYSYYPRCDEPYKELCVLDLL